MTQKTNQAAPEINIDLLRTMPLPDYSDDADKSTRGKLLIIGGSRRIPGAAMLAARAALRSGCGTVRVAAPESIATHIGIAVPELMVVPLAETPAGNVTTDALKVLEEQFKVCSAVVLGPGLDEDKNSDELARRVADNCPLPLLTDAQALCAIGEKKTKASAPRVWTPHDGEALMLTGEEVGEDREKVAKELAKARGAVVALKGRETIIATPDGAVFRNTAGSRALGTAGSGDALAGIIGSLLAQKMEATAATVWGVHLHALAGEALEQDIGADGVMARDFIDRLPQVIRYLRKYTSPKGDSKRVGLRHLT